MYILNPDFGSEFRIFVQTCKSCLEFTTFLADQDSGLVRDPSLSFDFNSRASLRRIKRCNILAIEFVHNHFVVVYTTSQSRYTCFAAVMKTNKNNELGKLKIFELTTCDSRVRRYQLKCKITPTHIIISDNNKITIFDFAFWKKKELKISIRPHVIHSLYLFIQRFLFNCSNLGVTTPLNNFCEV